jgi:hypothetical protein
MNFIYLTNILHSIILSRLPRNIRSHGFVIGVQCDGSCTDCGSIENKIRRKEKGKKNLFLLLKSRRSILRDIGEVFGLFPCIISIILSKSNVRI